MDFHTRFGLSDFLTHVALVADTNDDQGDDTGTCCVLNVDAIGGPMAGETLLHVENRSPFDEAARFGFVMDMQRLKLTVATPEARRSLEASTEPIAVETVATEPVAVVAPETGHALTVALKGRWTWVGSMVFNAAVLDVHTGARVLAFLQRHGWTAAYGERDLFDLFNGETPIRAEHLGPIAQAGRDFPCPETDDLFEPHR